MCKPTWQPSCMTTSVAEREEPAEIHDAATPKGGGSLDYRIGRGVHDFCQRNAVCKAAVDVLSLSGDEGVWYLAPAPFITFGFALRLLAALVARRPISQASCLEEIGCDVFGTISFALSFETVRF